MAKYEFDLSFGIKEVLDADAAKKVESQVSEQKKRMEEPIELTLNISDAKRRFKELEKEAKKVDRALQKALSAKNFDSVSEYTKQIANIQREQSELLSIIGDQTKAITQQSGALQDVEAAEKRRKKTIKNITAATEETVAVIQEQAEAIKQVAKAEEKLHRARRKSSSSAALTDGVIKDQKKALDEKLRTQEQVSTELEKELQTLKEIEDQQKRNEAARERFKQRQANYGKEALGVDHPVYDQDLLQDASKELKEFNALLETRNKYQEKYNRLCRIVEDYYVSNKPGKYAIGNGVYQTLDQYVELNSSMRQLDALFESGQKTTNKQINELFRDVVRGLQAEGRAVLQLVASKQVTAYPILQDLEREESELNQEMQRLHDAREAQLQKINALRQEELNLIKRAGIEEQKKQAAIGSTTKKIKEQVATQDRLKLSPKKDSNGYTVPKTYTAAEGKYEISEGKTGWDVFQQDNIGMWHLIASYKTLNEIRNDASLLSREEIVVTEEIAREVKALAASYEELSIKAGRSAEFAKMYTEMLHGVQQGALSAADAIGRLSEFVSGGVKQPSDTKTPEVHKQELESVVQLVDNYGHALDDVNNKLMQGVKLLNEQGQILRLFHNSPNIFDTFDASKGKPNQGQALGAGNYLALAQGGEFNELDYGRYQTQWYANVQKPFTVGEKLFPAHADKIIDKFLADRAEGFQKHMLSKLLDGDVVEAIKDIAYESKTTVGEIFGHIGYDAIMDGAQINVFDSSKIHRANDSVLDIGASDFTSLRELLQQIWDERRIIENANQQIKKLSNQYSGKTAKQLESDLFSETLIKGYGWRDNVAKIASAFKELTGDLPKSDSIPEESMHAMVENYEFAKQGLQGYKDAVIEHEAALNKLNAKFNEQKEITDAITKSYLAGNISGIVNKESVIQLPTTDGVVEKNKKLISSYEGLAEAVEKYVTSSKQLWEAYDKHHNFDKFADERNAAIEQIASMFPDGRMMGGTSVKGYLQDQGMSRMYASKGAEATLVDIEKQLTQSKEDQVKLAQEAEAKALAQAEAEKKAAEEALKAAEAKEKSVAQTQTIVHDTPAITKTDAMLIEEAAAKTEEQATAETKVASAAEKTAKAKKKQADAASKAAGAAKVEYSDIVAKDLERALEQLRSAKNNETTIFSLKGVFDGDDLVSQAEAMIKNIAKQANLTLGNFRVQDDSIRVRLYNDELKITVDQMYRLRAATDDVEAGLELVSQAFNQNVKALHENTFDADGMQQRALAAIEKVRSSLHGLEYDLTGLEGAARSISSQDDFVKFSNQLKAAQDNIQAIKNSTVSKNSMNPLANMQRDMQNASIEIETMRLKLEKFGDIQGVAVAKQMLTEMTTAAEQYNKATSAQEQQAAYNQYSNLRSSFKAQTDYINAVKSLNASQESAAKQVDPIREQYQSLLDVINKINTVNSNITKYQGKDGGSGIFAGYIQQLQTDKEQLVMQLQSITQEINSTLGGGFVQGSTTYSLPLTKMLSDDGGVISSFLNDVKTQASLTTPEIEKLVIALQKAQNIDVEAAARVAEQFRSVQETYKQITSMSTLDTNGQIYQGAASVFAQIAQYKDSLSSDPTQWTPEQSANLQGLIDKFNEYGSVLVQVGQKEANYFAGKTKYAKDTSISSMAQKTTEDANKLSDVQKKLESAAQSFAKKSGAGDTFITGFTQSADGISKLDFSVFDNATGSLRNFRMEMGSVTEGMFITETTVNKSLSNIKAAQKQLSSVGDLLGRIKVSNVGTGDGNAPAHVSKLLDLYKQLSAEIKKGDNADQNKITKLTRDLKLAQAETEKLYKQMSQMEGAIAGGQAVRLQKIDPNGDVYGQLITRAQELAASHDNAALQVGKFDAATNTLSASLVHSSGAVEQVKVSMYGLNGECAAQQVGVKKLTTSWDTFKSTIMHAGKRLMTALVGYNVFYKAISEVRKGINYVKEIDLALTELKKVTDETEESYRNFLNTAASSAGKIGSTVSDFTAATANFARLGYTMDESAKMAETAIVYKNVADGLDTVDAATESIISTMKAFGIESNNTMQIIDVFNEVGNNFAITSAGIGEAMQRSASALYEAGNSFEESTALITAANSVIQNPEQVGTALKTLALRLRGAKVELEEAGLETDNMAESTSTLQSKLKALTHGNVDIMLDADTFKNTTQILREMSEVWEEMTDIEQASALELMGGKRQAKQKNCLNAQKCASANTFNCR